MKIQIHCDQCKTPFLRERKKVNFSIKNGTRLFCTSKCSGDYSVSLQPKRFKVLKISKRKQRDKKLVFKTCKICNNLYATKLTTCSPKCAKIAISNGGKKSAHNQSENRRSKNEKLFFDLCCKHFLKVENNKPIFNGWDADIIIHDIKVAILWNGKWHYEKITKKHSVEQVQNRDKIKLKEIQSYGYIPYVIKDMGKFNEEFIKLEFKKFIGYIAQIA